MWWIVRRDMRVTCAQTNHRLAFFLFVDEKFAHFYVCVKFFAQKNGNKNVPATTTTTTTTKTHLSINILKSYQIHRIIHACTHTLESVFNFRNCAPCRLAVYLWAYPKMCIWVNKKWLKLWQRMGKKPN